MNCSLKHSPWRPSTSLLRLRSPQLRPTAAAASPAASSHPRGSLSLKSDRLSPPKSFPVFECRAAREAQPTVVQQKILDFCFWKGPLPRGGFGECCLYSGLLSAAYFTYTIAAKHILGMFPYPWLLSGVYLTAGFLWTSVRWLAEGQDLPDLQFWKSLFPVAVANAIGHVAALVCLSRSSPAFAEIMRCGEAVFCVPLMSWFLLGGKAFPLPVYLSLLPIVGGCALAAFTELSFDTIGFIAATIANLAFASMNVLLERGIQKGKFRRENEEKVGGLDFAAYLSLLSLLIVTPFLLAIDGPRFWVDGLSNAPPHVTASSFLTLIVLLGLVYSNHIDRIYLFFPSMQPFHFFTINTLRKIFVIVFSMSFIKHVKPISAFGAAIVILGVFLHYRELCKFSESEAGSCDRVGFFISSC